MPIVARHVVLVKLSLAMSSFVRLSSSLRDRLYICCLYFFFRFSGDTDDDDEESDDFDDVEDANDNPDVDVKFTDTVMSVL